MMERQKAFLGVEQKQGASLGYAQGLSVNIKLGSKGLSGTSTLAYSAQRK
jgi:hypothetical protein